jgi:hypothetical protein
LALVVEDLELELEEQILPTVLEDQRLRSLDTLVDEHLEEEVHWSELADRWFDHF